MRTRTHLGATKTAAVVLSAALAACGGDPGATGTGFDQSRTVNGLSLNGLSQNGLSQNGLSQNGLSQNGLSQNGLNAPRFDAWWQGDPALANEVMTYVVACAHPAGSSLGFRDKATGITYTWWGRLGLAPVWAAGKSAIPVAEQQLVSACLAAHVNKFGIHVELSVRGYFSDGLTPIPVTAAEASAFDYDEACFFGNLYADQGLYLGTDQQSLNPNVTTPRGCAVEAGVNGECPPIVHLGLCKSSCTWDARGRLWKSCLANGTSYLPIVTYLRSSDTYRCGDGLCQFTEQPFDSATGLGCRTDCGLLQ
ncbi:MAG TPA: hypothetical protein VFI16_03595 [Anaeromyxobacteraceae bacterium]|nr:hypothetical protein [Anaeromyxobacteraceae bacterium]